MRKDYQLPRIDKPGVEHPEISVENIEKGVVHTYWLPDQQMEDNNDPTYKNPPVNKFPLKFNLLNHPKIVRIISEPNSKDYSFDFGMTAIYTSPTLVSDMETYISVEAATEWMSVGPDEESTMTITKADETTEDVVGNESLQLYQTFLFSTSIPILDTGAFTAPWQLTDAFTYYSDAFESSYSPIQMLPMMIPIVNGYNDHTTTLIYPPDHFPVIIGGWIVDNPPIRFFFYKERFIGYSTVDWLISNVIVYGTVEGLSDLGVTRITIKAGNDRDNNIYNGLPVGSGNFSGIDPDLLKIDLPYFPVDETLSYVEIKDLLNTSLMTWFKDFENSDIYVDHFYITLNNLTVGHE